MNIVRTVSDTRDVVADARRTGRKVGLVPTMGAFHEGHLSLMRRARAARDLVVASLFINPAQFQDPADLEAYPRDEGRDAALAAEVGVDLLFAPAPDEIYPEGFATRVSVGPLGETLEGAHRGSDHFDAVSTVVVKLLNIVGPDTVYFGQKDAQQTAVVKRLVRDLDIPVWVDICPTVRAEDGLALSSRNVRLSATERVRATALFRALRAAEQVIASGESDPAAAIVAGRRELHSSGIEPDYFELVDPQSFVPVRALSGDVLAVVAASLEGARLIDNLPIHVPSTEAKGNHNTNVAAYERALEVTWRPAA